MIMSLVVLFCLFYITFECWGDNQIKTPMRFLFGFSGTVIAVTLLMLQEQLESSFEYQISPIKDNTYLLFSVFLIIIVFISFFLAILNMLYWSKDGAEETKGFILYSKEGRK